MAVTATFLADFTSFTSAVEKAETKLRSFETGASKVERALTRVGDAYSGRNTLQQAQLAVKAIEDIGGATKLTEREQKQLNATLTEALAKYKALGLQAPEQMRALAAATAHVEKSATLSQRAMGALTGAVGQFAAGFT